MDYWLKGIILIHTLKSHEITPVEKANVLRVTIELLAITNIKTLVREGGTVSGS